MRGSRREAAYVMARVETREEGGCVCGMRVCGCADVVVIVGRGAGGSWARVVVVAVDRAKKGCVVVVRELAGNPIVEGDIEFLVSLRRFPPQIFLA